MNNSLRSLFSLAVALVIWTGVVSSDPGDLLVSNFDPDNILQYDTETPSLIGEFVAAGSGGLDGPWDATFGPDDNLYVASSNTNNILRFDGSTGAFIDVFASGGGLEAPIAAVFAPDGDLYVTGAGNPQVLRFDGSTGVFVSAFTFGWDLHVPRGMVFGPDGNIYVAHFEDNVVRFSGETGWFIDIFVETGSGGLKAPGDLTFGPDGHLYVASRDSDAVIRYNGATGSFLDVFATAVKPIGLVFGPDRFFYVSGLPTDSSLSSIRQYNAHTGAFVSTIATSLDGQLQRPVFLTFVPPGDVEGQVCICHARPGQSGKDHTICVGAAALPAHLAHGDALGPCPSMIVSEEATPQVEERQKPYDVGDPSFVPSDR